MEFTKTPFFTDEQKREMRLNICKLCIFSHCNGNQANKCEVDSLVCGKDNDKNIIAKTSNVSEACPMDFWSQTNGETISWPTRSGCGCGK